MDHRDRFEEIFRERLYNLEYNPETKQDKKLILPVRWYNRFTISQIRIAAVIAAIFFLAVVNWLLIRTNEKTKYESPETLVSGIPQTNPDTSISSQPDRIIENVPVSALVSIVSQHKVKKYQEPKMNFDTTKLTLAKSNKQLISTLPGSYLQDCPTPSVTKPRIRKWHFGMGSSQLGVAGISTNTGGGDQYYNNSEDPRPRPDSPQQPDQHALLTRSQTISNYTPSIPTKQKHLPSISFGLSLSRPLNERWSLNTGLTYSCLRSKWQYEYGNQTIQRQRLHFIGIPLAVSYRLTHWQSPYCYCSFGMLGEINIAGQLRNAQGTHSIRIPGTLWTAHTKLGLAYPLIRFVSVYAEGGCCYYFKYKGNIETISIKNSLNMTGQIGIRLNF